MLIKNSKWNIKISIIENHNKIMKKLNPLIKVKEFHKIKINFLKINSKQNLII